MSKELTKMTTLSHHRLWAELDGDSALAALRLATLGWVPGKRERVGADIRHHAFCLLARGSGTFLGGNDATPQPVRAPGIFFVAPGMRHDYGPTRGSRWEEFYWILEGPRIEEWKRAGWWRTDARFEGITAEAAAALETLFRTATTSLAERDRTAIDLAKVDLERWLAEHCAITPASPSPLAGIVTAWRREPARVWSLRAAAAGAGMSYTRFRARFRAEHGISPYAYLLRLRLELAARWLRATNEPIKAIAVRAGFGSTESFIRAFGQRHGVSPARWRRRFPEMLPSSAGGPAA